MINVQTPRSLLQKIKKRDDEESWDKFYTLYAPVVFAFIRKLGFDETSAEDILQESMCQIVRYIPNFDYQPGKGRFSTYLCAIVRKAISRYLSRQKLDTRPFCASSDESECFQEDSVSHDYFSELEQIRKKQILKLACNRVKDRIEPATWNSFNLFVLAGKKSAEEVAAELGIKDRNSVYQHKSRVISLLKKEVQLLETEIGDFDESDLWKNSDFTDSQLKTLEFDSEMPSIDVGKRISIIRMAFVNQPPPCGISHKLFVITAGNNWWEELKESYTVGSETICDLQLDSNYISKKHCLILNEDGKWKLKDLNSKNGTIVNGKKLSEKLLLDGDLIQLGDVLLLFAV